MEYDWVHIYECMCSSANGLITLKVKGVNKMKHDANKGSKGGRNTQIGEGGGGGRGLRRWYLYLSSVRGGKGNNKWMHPGAREWPKKNPQWY